VPTAAPLLGFEGEKMMILFPGFWSPKKSSYTKFRQFKTWLQNINTSPKRRFTLLKKIAGSGKIQPPF